MASLTLTPEQLDVLTRTVLGEARGEGNDGMAAVAQVIRNRSLSGQYPSDPRDVALQPYQFSTWNRGEGGNNPQQFSRNSNEYQNAAQIVQQVFGGNQSDPTNGALFYHTPAVNPSWSGSVNQYGTTQLGNHIFYNGRPVPPAEIPNVVASELDVQPRVAPIPQTIGPIATAQRNRVTPATPAWIDIYKPPQEAPMNTAANAAARRAALSIGANQTMAGQSAEGPLMRSSGSVPGQSNINAQRVEQLAQRQGSVRQPVYPNAAQLQSATGFRVPNLSTQPSTTPKLQDRLVPTVSPVVTSRVAPIPATQSGDMRLMRNPIMSAGAIAPVPASLSPGLMAARSPAPLMAAGGAPLRITVSGAPILPQTAVQALQAQGMSSAQAYDALNARARGGPTVEDRVTGRANGGGGDGGMQPRGTIF